MKIALFDLDNTLLPLDSDYQWGEFTVSLGWADAKEFQERNHQFYLQYTQGRLDIHEYVRFATQTIRSHGPQKAALAHEQFMAQVVRPAMQASALNLVKRHQDAGDAVLIVTATNEFVTRPIAKAFGVDELIAVELERDAQGLITGEIKGTPSFREGKVVRVEQWLAARGLLWGDVDTTFYSDSTNDLPLLERVNHPVAANPDERLRTVAQERGWRILELFSSSPPSAGEGAI